MKTRHSDTHQVQRTANTCPRMPNGTQGGLLLLLPSKSLSHDAGPIAKCKGRPFTSAGLCLTFRGMCKSRLSPSLGNVAGLRQQTVGRQLSAHVPQPSCCQTFPADYQDHSFRVCGRGDGKLFASAWPGFFICETVWIILKHEEIKSFHEVVKTTRKVHPYKSQCTASWFRDPFPYTTICTS